MIQYKGHYEKCAKCGYSCVDVQFRHTETDPLSVFVLKEHLECKCKRCGFSWVRKPLDQE